MINRFDVCTFGLAMRMCCIALLSSSAAVACFQSPASNDAVQANRPDSESELATLSDALADLASPKFATRRAAYRILVESGINGIETLERHSTETKDHEAAERCVKAIAEIAEDPDAFDSAVQALERLGETRITGVSKSARQGVKRLRMNDEARAIEALQAAGVRVQLNRQGHVTNLALSRDQDLVWLRDLPELRYVSLTSQQITDACVGHLIECQNLSSLSFYRTAITDIGLGHIPKLKRLRSLSMSGKQFTGDGIRQLRNVNSLTTFSWMLSSTEPQLEAIGELKQINSLSLLGLAATEKAIKVVRKMDNLNQLSLSLPELTDQQCASLASIKITMRLSVSRSPEITSEGWQNLGKLNLQSLSLYRCPFGDSDLKFFGATTSLTTLSISDAEITDAGLMQLNSLTNLRYMSLRNTKVTEEGAAALKKVLPNLSRINLSNR